MAITKKRNGIKRFLRSGKPKYKGKIVNIERVTKCLFVIWAARYKRNGRERMLKKAFNLMFR